MLFWKKDAAFGDAWITFLSFLVIWVAVAVVFMAGLPGAAPADTASVIAPSNPQAPSVDSGWQAGTCKEEPEITDANPADFCNVESNPGKYFFEDAAAHPNYGFTQFIVAHHSEQVLLGQILEQPSNELAYVRVELPVGLAVNPGATGRCPIAVFEEGAAGCQSYGSQVGESGVTTAVTSIVPIAPFPGLTAVPVFNLVPKQGQAARFGLELLGNEVFLEGDIAAGGDYHEGFTIQVPHALPLETSKIPLLGGLLSKIVPGLILKNRLVFNGRAGDGTFITTPSTCHGQAFTESGGEYSTLLRAASYEEIEAGEQFPAGAGAYLESPIPPGTSPKNCNSIPYAPTIGVAPGTTETNAPAPASVTVSVPHVQKATGQDDSTTQAASLSLPVGMGINPSAAAAVNNLKTCDNSQFALHSTAAISCPPTSRIGTATIASAALPEGNLEGPVYIAKQESTDPASGNEYRIFIDAASARYGIDVRLRGHVAADPTTGQLATTITEIPQVPFTSFRLDFVGGQKSVLSSPSTCGPNTSAARMTPYSGTAPATPTQAFSLQATPGGGPCAASLAARPFAPSFVAAPKSDQAGAYSPLHIAIGRTNGQQELKGATVALAPGMIAKLAGIPYCPGAQINAAATTSGASQAAKSSCPAKSEVGTASVQAGTAATPLSITGKVFLSGPYHGAPLSLAVITPATAGPFDLGTVVVRVALFVDPESTQVTAVSDPIPDVFGGSQLSIRSIAIDLSKKEFTLNPTSCDKLSTTAALAGGGANPASSSAWSSFAAQDPFQTSNCNKLDFQPKLVTRFLGGKKQTHRAGHPKLRATLTARAGDANLAQATVTLPPSELIDQGHIKTICTRVQLAADDCPEGSVYGEAKAESPLLDKPLSGPVYLVSSNHVLPDLLADLKGQVEVRLHGVVKSVKGHRIRTTFSPIPDVPVSTFTLTMDGGQKGLIQNSRNLCTHKYFSKLNFLAQNGKTVKTNRLPLGVAACHGKPKAKAKHQHSKKKNNHK
jgi:hypothetical protein